ncbi:MAG: hypothetical protein IH953_00005 [Chloroflexi bacterium]|nr:hypothetical protein [Chloroflexota bacterium]
MNAFSRIPFHPFFFAIYPVIVLLALNSGDLQPSEGLRSLAASVSLTALLFLLLGRLLRNSAKAAALTSLAILLFFSYGHVYELVRNLRVADVLIGRHRFLLTLSFLITVTITLLVAKRRQIGSSITVFLNLFSILALVVPVGQLVAAGAKELSSGETAEIIIEPLPNVDIPAGTIPPDIYYIILDAYTRADVLLNNYQYDNSSFLRSLEELGFTIARDSRSNYAVTRLSIPSSLNMEYIESIGPALDSNATDAAWLDRATKGNAVRKTLAGLGYRIVAFETAYGMTEWPESDLYLSPRRLSLSDQRAFSDVNQFEVLLIQTSMGRLAIDFGTVLNNLFGTSLVAPHQAHADRISFALDRLGRMAEISGPKFVFMHLMSPHPPYVFAPSGEFVGEDGIYTLASREDEVGEIAGYRNQVAFLNSRLQVELKTLLESSENQPIIVIQGDHGGLGVSPEDRMKILNAYYLPDGGNALIYDEITPVNTFRLIFDHYFDGDLPLLEDRSYYSDLERPFELLLLP